MNCESSTEINSWFKDKRGIEFNQFPVMGSSVPFLFINGASTERMAAKASLNRTQIVFKNSIMPVCSWVVVDSSGETIVSGRESIPEDVQVTKAAEQAQIQSGLTSALNSTSSRHMSETEASVTTKVTEVVKVKTVSKVLLPCWHIISNIPTAEEFKAPSHCPECNVTVEKAVDSY